MDMGSCGVIFVDVGTSGKYWEKRFETLGVSMALMWSSRILILSSLSLMWDSREVTFVFAIFISCCRYSRRTVSGVTGGVAFVLFFVSLEVGLGIGRAGLVAEVVTRGIEAEKVKGVEEGRGLRFEIKG